jgi:hypothetical protein
MRQRKSLNGYLLVLTVIAATITCSQTLSAISSPNDESKTELIKLYADAHPYLDLPFPELKKRIHELSEMTPASSQEPLPDLLDRVGVKAGELLQKVPNLVSEEAVNRSRYVTADASGRPASVEEDETFHYLILTRSGAFGRGALSEFRTTRKGKSVDQMVESPNFQGFLSAWVLFDPVNQVESRFRYLGQQQIEGHNSYVVGFAQLPGTVESTARPILLQGIAWIDQSDYRIVRLRTDLLAPLPERQLLKQTAEIVFGAVEITQVNLQLWLPRLVDFEMEANGQFVHEDHKYLDYRLYNATTDGVPERKSSLPTQPLVSASSGTQVEALTEAKLYADARPYMDEPVSELRKTIHELAGMTPVSSQDQLSDVLAKTGTKADELLHKLPDLISDEGVTESHYSQEAANGCLGVRCIPADAPAPRNEMFHYMILTHPAPDGRQGVSEYRTTRNDKPVGQAAAGAPTFQGFISAWIVFSSANRPESRFRYLGQQRVNGRATYVLGFAQTPGSVESPGVIVVNNESIPMLLQGIAWVDQSDYRIVHLRTDLLAPLPLIGLEQLTAIILFGPVHIRNFADGLWLPKTVNLQMEVRSQFVREEHNYWKYRLYAARSRVIVSADN